MISLRRPQSKRLILYPGRVAFCRCVCGKELEVKPSKVRAGTTHSCGCFRAKALADGRAGHHARYPAGLGAFNDLLLHYKRGASRRHLAWELTREEFATLTTQNCRYCGTVPNTVNVPSNGHNGTYTYNGIDRLDNAIGYIGTNVCACCERCNKAKLITSEGEFISRMTRIALRFDQYDNLSTDCAIVGQSVTPDSPEDYASRQLFCVYRSMAARRNKQWSISLDVFRDLTSRICYYCGIGSQSFKAWRPDKTKGYRYNGIDRVDNFDGYTVANSVSCCEDCNKSKMTMSKHDFISLARAVARATS